MDSSALSAAPTDLSAAAAVFAALGHPRRLAILRSLPATTSELRAALLVEPLDDLRLLERAGLVVRCGGVAPVRWVVVDDLAGRVAGLLG